ncbi:MAG: hypothetical protein J0L81_01815 [Caulobacterales bacterium]|jgi:hypothetical protein|nr:hypothetical protein [Caulobacterales bacterium]
MKPVRELRKKVAARAEKKAQVYSTSEARANFAEALETAQLENAVIGFDRYGRPVAALVSIDAVRLLAGRDQEVEPATQEKIRRLASIFLHALPASKAVAPKAAPKPVRAKRPAKNVAPPKKKLAAAKKKPPAKAKRRRKTMGKGP